MQQDLLFVIPYSSQMNTSVISFRIFERPENGAKSNQPRCSRIARHRNEGNCSSLLSSPRASEPYQRIRPFRDVRPLSTGLRELNVVPLRLGPTVRKRSFGSDIDPPITETVFGPNRHLG